jgi:ribonuclease HI
MVFIYFDGGMITLDDGRKVGVCGAYIQHGAKASQFSKLIGVSEEMEVIATEYSGLIGALKVYHKLVETGRIPADEQVMIRGDNSTVVKVVESDYADDKYIHKGSKYAPFRPYAIEARALFARIRNAKIEWISRDKNKRADALCNRELGEYRKANNIKFPSSSAYFKSQFLLNGVSKPRPRPVYHVETSYERTAKELGYKGSYRGDPRCGNYIPPKFKPLLGDIVDTWNELPPHCECGLCGQPTNYEQPLTKTSEVPYSPGLGAEPFSHAAH